MRLFCGLDQPANLKSKGEKMLAGRNDVEVSTHTQDILNRLLHGRYVFIHNGIHQKCIFKNYDSGLCQ